MWVKSQDASIQIEKSYFKSFSFWIINLEIKVMAMAWDKMLDYFKQKFGNITALPVNYWRRFSIP